MDRVLQTLRQSGLVANKSETGDVTLTLNLSKDKRTRVALQAYASAHSETAENRKIRDALIDLLGHLALEDSKS